MIQSLVEAHTDIEVFAGVQQGVTDYILGLTDERPTILQTPLHINAARTALRAVPGMDGKPHDWENRHRDVQLGINPDLSEAFEFSETKGRGKKADDIRRGAIKLLLTLGIDEMLDQEWRKRAACKDADPNIFHPPLPEETDYNPEPLVTAEEKEQGKLVVDYFCSSCPVQVECTNYGYGASKFAAGITVYGKPLAPNSRDRSAVEEPETINSGAGN